MRSSFTAIILTGLGIAVAGPTHADVVVHLRSGGTIHGDRSWTEGDMVNVQMGSDVASFAPSAIESIEQVPGAEHPGNAAADANPAKGTAKNTAKNAPAPQGAAAPAKSEPAKAAAATGKSDLVPTVQGEDTATKLARLDGISMQTHRELSIARRQGASAEKLKDLEDKIDEVNRQRAEAMRKLGMMH